ncbi:MAG: hypothetical protein IPM64_17220 [Phycisphaerales bacterium]|nr:hypothetical protein [Phycisphaerales bacterium]
MAMVIADNIKPRLLVQTALAAVRRQIARETQGFSNELLSDFLVQLIAESQRHRSVLGKFINGHASGQASGQAKGTK